MFRQTVRALMAALAVAVISACGGGGGGSGGNQKAVALKTVGLSATGQKVGGLEVSFTIPNGVTVALTPDVTLTGGTSINGVITVSGAPKPANISTVALYTPATAAAPGKLTVQVYDVEGFAAEETISIVMDIVPGYVPLASDFIVDGNQLIVTDMNGNVSTVNVSYVVEIS